MSEIRVAVNGAKGKMGTATVVAVRAAENMRLVAETDLGDALAETLKESHADVCVDFTHPHAALTNALSILDAGVRPVIGTTGFTESDIEVVRQAAAERKLGAMIVPNFAIGAVLMMRFARQAVDFFTSAEVIELHHDRKVDAPSGTALATAQGMAKARTKPFPTLTQAEGASLSARGAVVDGIHVHSIRLPGLLAHQSVILGDPGQTLTIRHDTLDRSCFMPGVLRAIRAVVGLERLVVGLEPILFRDAP